MRQANLTDTHLAAADLTHADLSTANMASTILIDANLTQAWFPVDAIPPEGWAVGLRTGRLERVNADQGDDA
jgi:uncharacterized protein YjbI with pentapeptide repeats